ncbi:hypothetical protein LB576_25375 [Mesorhizobium sp. B294B1A1]|nr:hypothetical protein [Mesorhizobium sp. B294B1A1]
MWDAEFGTIRGQQLRILDPADRRAAIAGKRKMASDGVDSLRHPLKTRAQDDGDRLVFAGQVPKRLDDALAVDAVL